MRSRRRCSRGCSTARGDIFASVLVGRILQGNVPQAAVQAAAAFVAECIRQTPEGADERLGVWLETALPKLRAGVKNKQTGL